MQKYEYIQSANEAIYIFKKNIKQINEQLSLLHNNEQKVNIDTIIKSYNEVYNTIISFVEVYKNKHLNFSSENQYYETFQIKKFEGVKLEEYFKNKGKIVKNSRGIFYLINYKVKIKLNFLAIKDIKKKFLNNLIIIDGIGEVLEKKLKNEGFNTIIDLLKHNKYRYYAEKFLDILKLKDGFKLIEWIERRYPKSHQLVFFTSYFFDPKDFIFIDIETLGLHGNPLFLIGIAYFENKELLVMQLLARELSEESAVLESLNEILKTKKVIFSFNGKSFDIPFIKSRMNYYRINDCINHPHYDIFHFSKKAFKTKENIYSLTNIEKEILKLKRKNDIPSYLIPDYYSNYEKTNNIGYLIPIIEHNKQDIISMVKILEEINRKWI